MISQPLCMHVCLNITIHMPRTHSCLAYGLITVIIPIIRYVVIHCAVILFCHTGVCICFDFMYEPAIRLPVLQCNLMWLGLWRFYRSPCRCQLTLALMTTVLVEAGGKAWLLWPCDISVTVISAFTLWVPALHRRLGSPLWIQRLRCAQGFKSLQNSSECSRGLFICSALSGSVSAFILWFNPTSATFFTCSCSEDWKVPGITPAQVYGTRLLSLQLIYTYSAHYR